MQDRNTEKSIRAVRSLRLRYIIGLSVIALLVTASYVTMQRVISEQRNFASLINLAGHQSGQVNRIAYFSSLMATTDDETEFQMAKAQVGRTINKLREGHAILHRGDPESGEPPVLNDELRMIYDDPTVGLHHSLTLFIENAERVYASDMEELSSGSISFIFLTTYGPHVLEPMLDAAVDEYEKIGKAAILQIERLEVFIWITALVVLLLEIQLIFRPLEGHVRNSIKSLEKTVSEMRITRKRLVAAQELALVGDWQFDSDGNTLTWSDQVYRICGVSPKAFDVTLDSFLSLIHNLDRSMVATSFKTVRSNNQLLNMKYRVVRPDGGERLVNQQVVVRESEYGGADIVSGTIQDITETRELSTRLQKLSENIPGFIFQFQLGEDGNSWFPYASKGIGETIGVQLDQVRHSAGGVIDLVHAGDVKRLRQKIALSARDLNGWQARFRLNHPERGVVWLEGHATPERIAGGGVLWHGYLCDVTERKHSEDQIRQLALYDPLTKLANRRLLRERLKLALACARRTRTWGALLMLDMDNFKTLNDTQGHNIGDALLVEVSGRLQECVRETDTICRLGGDEFVIVLEWVGDTLEQGEKKSIEIAERVRAALGRPYILGEQFHVYHASASIGIALFSGGGESDGELLKRADVAMFEAKELGRNRVCLFTEQRQSVVTSRSTMAANLQRAIDGKQFALHYQPQFFAQGRLCGAEALLRWTPPGDLPVSPATFIPLAEETGMIIPIGEWVLETACRDLLELTGSELPDHFKISVNISPCQLSDSDFLDKVEEIIARSGVDSRYIKMELTETSLIQDLDRGRKILHGLRHLGISVDLDDFGTGYSSLNSLKNLPLDALKLDCSLVHGIGGDVRDEAIVRAAIAMAKALSLTIVAEGVESVAQQDFLVREGCDMLQGYLLGKPIPFEVFTRRWVPLDGVRKN